MRLVKIITLSRNTVSLALFLSCCLQLSAQENSPYSRYGLGDQVPNGNIINRAMGGVSTAYFDYQSINYLNPATYSKLRVTTFDLGFEVDSRTLREPNNPGKFSASSANISYVQLGIPIVPKRSWGLNLGLRPVTRVNYKVLTAGRTSFGDSLQTLYEGTGGSYDVFAGTGIAFGNFSIGFNAAYSFGTKDYSTRNSFVNDSVLYLQSNYQTKSTFGGFTFQGGALYSAKLSKSTWLRLGVTGQFERTINANRDKLEETFEYDANGATFQIDSVYAENNRSGTVTYPGSFSAGILVDKENEWSIGADFTSTKWSKYQFFGEQDPLQNSWMMKVGGQWTPDLLRGRNYWSRVTYRAGMFYGLDYIKADTDLPVLGFTAGLAFPIRRMNYTNQFTVINTAFEIGRRGNDDNKIRENFFRISVGLSLSDLWFIKRKYE
ncbi:MAG TPA: hypothetical protein VD996_01335 [Chitinophagaceae bacterium]|nr:hypothetical protein [Chitinophagaceae bacterium]